MTLLNSLNAFYKKVNIFQITICFTRYLGNQPSLIKPKKGDFLYKFTTIINDSLLFDLLKFYILMQNYDLVFLPNILQTKHKLAEEKAILKKSKEALS